MRIVLLWFVEQYQRLISTNTEKQTEKLACHCEAVALLLSFAVVHVLLLSSFRLFWTTASSSWCSWSSSSLSLASASNRPCTMKMWHTVAHTTHGKCIECFTFTEREGERTKYPKQISFKHLHWRSWEQVWKIIAKPNKWNRCIDFESDAKSNTDWNCLCWNKPNESSLQYLVCALFVL